MDKVFNALNMSKEQFVNTYIRLATDWWNYQRGTLVIKKDGKILDADHANAVYMNIQNVEWYEDGTYQNNRLPLYIKPYALPGLYTVEITYETKSTEAAYKQVVITDEFRIELS